MSDDLFESPKALLNWAYEDARRFKELERAFFDGQPYDQFTEFDEEMGRDAYRIRFNRIVPDEMRKLASHVINDLRHSLDQAFTIATRFFGRAPSRGSKHIYFPWVGSPKMLRDRLDDWGIPAEIHPIVFEAQPYPAQNDATGGNDIVRQLGKIAGPNKHEAALSASAVARVTELSVKWEGDWVIPFVHDMWDSSKEQLTLGYFPAGSKGNHNAEIICMITFRDVPELAGYAVSDLLEYWGSYANHFVKRFEGRVIEAGA